MRPSLIPARLLLLAAAPCLLAPTADTDIPWPHGAPPTSDALSALVTDALVIADRERFETFLEAFEKGEDSEHVQLFQEDIDQNNYGYADLQRLFRFGDSFFEHAFRSEDGYGHSVNPQLQRVHSGVYGGRDTFSCSGCHSVGGTDGAGSETQNAFLLGDGDRASSANVRNAPAVLGLGFVQALGAEMTFDLRAQRDNALKEATSKGHPVGVLLSSKGVSFGKLVAAPNGDVDTSGIEGVDPDLEVKPFGWKGNVARLRRFAEDAARVHFGIQSDVLCSQYEIAPDPAKLGPGPNWYDPDDDGKFHELLEGLLTASAIYMAQLESPILLPPHDPGLRDRWARGSTLFDEVGCATCHVRHLQLAFSSWSELPDTTGGPPVTLNLVNDGEQPRSSLVVELFSDLKRHDMGEDLADKNDDPAGLVPRSVFLTRPLWGLADTPPYLHDGRAATIPAAILAHGGDAAKSRDAFAHLPADEQADLHIFLLSMTREPKPRVAR